MLKVVEANRALDAPEKTDLTRVFASEWDHSEHSEHSDKALPRRTTYDMAQLRYLFDRPQ